MRSRRDSVDSCWRCHRPNGAAGPSATLGAATDRVASCSGGTGSPRHRQQHPGAAATLLIPASPCTARPAASSTAAAVGISAAAGHGRAAAGKRARCCLARGGGRCVGARHAHEYARGPEASPRCDERAARGRRARHGRAAAGRSGAPRPTGRGGCRGAGSPSGYSSGARSGGGRSSWRASCCGGEPAAALVGRPGH
jgi:hypothetical protein